MNTIEQAFFDGVLADIVYVDGFTSGMTAKDLADVIKFRVSEPLATAIGERFEVVAVKSDPASEYQGVVFRDKTTDQLYLANRGTESLKDILVADLDLALVSGIATKQTTAMTNWWLQISRAAGTSVPQIVASATQNFIAQPSVNATGEIAAALAASGGKVRVVGHSLGGHLTSVFASLFSDQIAHSSTFNGAGLFSTGATLNFTTWMVNFMSGAPLALAASLIGAQVHLPGTNQDNFYAYNGLSLTTNSLTFTQLGERIGIFNEQSTTFGTDVPNHFMYKLTDVLALMTAVEKLDPTANIAKLSAAFEASSNTKKASDESLLDALRRVILGGEVAPTPPIDDGGDWKVSVMPPERTQYHQNLSDLQTNDSFKALIGKVTVSLPDASLATTARTDFASLLTLLTLSPVALKATAGNEGAVEAALAANWETAHTDWQADQALTPGQRAEGQGNYTDQYLKDRAAFLANIITANLADTGDGKALRVDVVSSDVLYFDDKTSGITLQQVSELTGETNGPRYIFGGDDNDTIFSGDEADHLYGGAGMDRIDGGKGADYLEGNAGSDILTGGEGRDTLLGGVGSDILEGGKESDRLNGGLGDDTYKFTSGDGWDWIEDKDGVGHIEYDGVTLGAQTIKQIAPNVWQEQTGSATVTYSRYDRSENGETYAVLSIQGPDGGMWVKRWSAGQLGITLPDALPPEILPIATPDTTIKKTDWYNDYHTVIDASSLGRVQLAAVGDYGEVTGSGKLLGNDAANYLHNGEGDDELYGLGGKDTLICTGGNDKLYGGDGDDALAGGDGDDLLDGGIGSDVLAGGHGSDVMDGGDGDDYLFGGGDYSATRSDWSVTLPAEPGAPINFNQFTGLSSLAGDGADLIKGGAGNDYLWGGEGGDQLDGGVGNDQLVGDSEGDHLIGGDGDDKLFGDVSQSASPLLYTLPEYHGDDILDGGAGNDFLSGDGGADELYGGDGNDILVGDANGVPIEYHGADYLDGGAGNDKLYGYGKDDRLFGGAGDDLLEGDSSSVAFAEHGNDYLDGEDGNDTLQGDGGDDILFGGSGNDQLFGDSDDTPTAHQGDDWLDGGEGDDYLRGYAGNDMLIGGAGQDELLAEAGDDALDGGAGDDILDAGAGNDTLTGGSGTDALTGGAGDDTYLFQSGDGAMAADGTVDAIFDDSGNDTVRLEGVSAGSLMVSAALDGSVLLLEYGTDKLAIVDGVSGAVENFQIGDETLSSSELIGRYAATAMSALNASGQQVTSGGWAGDSLASAEAFATLSGGRGNDTISASGDNATLLYSIGDGTDSVTTGGSGNVLRLGAGITAADLKLGLGSLALYVGNDANDVIHFENFDAANPLAQKPFERIEFADGSSIGYEDLLSRGFDLTGTSGDDAIDGSGISDRMTGGAGNGSDILVGGAGDDANDKLWRIAA